MPPKSKLSYPMLKENVIYSVVKGALGEVEIDISDEELLIALPQSVKLPHSKMEQPYSLEVHVELNSLLEDIWKGENVDFSTVIEEFKKSMKSIF